MQRRTASLVGGRRSLGPNKLEATGSVDRQHPLIGIQRIYWRRWFALGLALLPAAPVIARETIVLQKSGTDSQARGADATLISGDT